ncbi:MAG: hypothetical protein RL069_1766 [Planctomycetota bacterium]
MIGLHTVGSKTALVRQSVAARSTGMLWLCAVAMILSMGSGCRQRAITELYSEDMARRNRALEDLVYDFDAENQAMEFEIEDLRRTNAQLQGRLQEVQRQRSLESRGSTGSPSDKPRVTESKPLQSGGEKSPSDENSARKSPAPLKLPSNRSGGANTAEEIPLVLPEIVVPAPNKETKETLEGVSKPLDSQPPSLTLPEPAPLLPNSPSAPPPSILPPTEPPALPPTVPGVIPSSGGGEDQPKGRSSLLKPAPNGLPSDSAQIMDPRRRINAPRLDDNSSTAGSVELASGTAPLTKQPSTKQPVIKPIGPKDRRIREIDWHPSLCRARNTDGKPGDDGLYLVLVPRNSLGEFVPEVGNLTLVVEETIADGSVSRVGRWEYGADELQDLLEPIGSAPGIHLPVDWLEHPPTTSQVEVYVKFTLEDGTTMVNRKTLPLKRFSNGASTWTPR